MKNNVRNVHIRLWVETALVALATTSLLVMLNASPIVAGLTFLCLVVWFASRMGLKVALFAALLTSAAFDYFFLLPLRTLRLAGSAQATALVTFLLSSYVVGRLAEQLLNKKHEAELRRCDLERLYQLSQTLLRVADVDQLYAILPTAIEKIFPLGAVWVHRDEASLPDEGPRIPLQMGVQTLGWIGWKKGEITSETRSALCAQVALALARTLSQQLAAQAVATQESERLRTALTDSLTHELRTPLTAIRAAITTLRSSPGLDEETQRELAEIIEEESTQLDHLIGEAVEMATIDAGAVHIVPLAVRPAELLEAALQTAHEGLRNHRIVVSVHPDAEGLFWLDPHVLGRALQHLLENAAAHTPAGTGVRLNCYTKAQRLCFKLDDDGPGIDPVDLPQIFDRFYRGRQRPLQRKGSGMGLAIALALVKAHGGGLEAANLSAPEHGASFHLWIPLTDAAPHPGAVPALHGSELALSCTRQIEADSEGSRAGLQ